MVIVHVVMCTCGDRGLGKSDMSCERCELNVDFTQDVEQQFMGKIIPNIFFYDIANLPEHHSHLSNMTITALDVRA